MKTINVNLYTFEELSPEAQKKAIEKYHDINVDYNWWEFIYENFTEKNNKYFDIDKIYFSGFYSQGDGAMFEYKNVTKSFLFSIIDGLNLPNWKKEILKNVDFSFYGDHSGPRSNFYCHENTAAHFCDWYEPRLNYDKMNCNNIEDFLHDHLNIIQKEVIFKYKNLCRELYRNLEKEYNFLTSEEAIKETLICNDYEFTSDGEIY